MFGAEKKSIEIARYKFMLTAAYLYLAIYEERGTLIASKSFIK